MKIMSTTTTNTTTTIPIRSAGKYKMNVKDYVVQDGDIIQFKFNTPSKPKEKK